MQNVDETKEIIAFVTPGTFYVMCWGMRIYPLGVNQTLVLPLRWGVFVLV